jgi:phenylalanyl-tRNA synthetase alpha chain
MENYIQLIEDIKNKVDNIVISSLEDLESYRVEYLGANGVLKETFSVLKQVPVEYRREYGSKLNELKIYLETFYEKNMRIIL